MPQNAALGARLLYRTVDTAWYAAGDTSTDWNFYTKRGLLAAVYAAALVLGNAEMPHRTATKSFIEGLGWLSQIGLFVMLGLLLSPDQLTWTGA